MGRYIAEDYSTINVWLAPAEYTPSGICYPDKCVSAHIRTSVVRDEPPLTAVVNGMPSGFSFSHETLAVSAYITEEDSGEYVLNVFLLPSDKTEKEFTPPCADYADADVNSDWERISYRLRAYLPQIRTCGVTSFTTYYTGSGFAVTGVSPTGEIRSAVTEYTHNEDGHIPLETQLTSGLLIPGRTASVFFRMYDLPEEYYLGSFNFQTDIFTGATVIGCGVVTRRKVYKDKNKPEKGYTYEYVPIKGGIGSNLQDEWLFDKNLRWCVEYFGKRYWLKSAYPCRLANGSFAAVAKNFSLPRDCDPDIDSSCVKTTLSEANDRIVPEKFYG